MSKNILNQKFIRNPSIKWNRKSDTSIEVILEHRGFFAAIATHLFGRPKKSRIQLDELGSFVWLQLEKNHTIMEISGPVHDTFGEKAEPLLPRLATFFQILKDNHLIVCMLSPALKEKAER